MIWKFVLHELEHSEVLKYMLNETFNPWVWDDMELWSDFEEDRIAHDA